MIVMQSILRMSGNHENLPGNGGFFIAFVYVLNSKNKYKIDFLL